MDCPDCGVKLTDSDFGAAVCQSCGEPMLPDDLDKLRGELGIEPQQPPNLVIPIGDSSPVLLPDHLDCPQCQAPLMGDDLEKWLSSNGCSYCGAKPTEPTDQKNNDHTTGSSNETSEISTTTHTNTGIDSIKFIINTFPLQGMIIQMPMGVIGRTQFTGIKGASTIESFLQKISRDHLSIERFEDDNGSQITVMDLGSSNGTLVNGVNVVGLDKITIKNGDVLTIGSLNVCPIIDEDLIVEHLPSGIKIPMSNDSFHLGRLDQLDNRESWFRLASEVMQDSDKMDPASLEFISRNHATVVMIEGEPSVTQNPGKEEWTLSVDEKTNSFKVILRTNSFNFSDI
jgi:hypothetical protein